MAWFVLIALVAKPARAEVSFGAGFGALYSGLGINLGLKRSTDFRYLGVGCLGVGHSDSAGWSLPCGVGVGWIWANILPGLGNQHGVGFYAGPVGHRSDDNGKDRYGMGISYMYFWKGIDSRGLVVGVTPAVGNDGGQTKGRVLITIGYQF
ncbi:MAG: hypothetical protein HY207_03160 [Nitrospirae bacterium]|nr:hypothetical protein [Nitrospirota bacterium]